MIWYGMNSECVYLHILSHVKMNFAHVYDDVIITKFLNNNVFKNIWISPDPFMFKDQFYLVHNVVTHVHVL